MRFPLAAAIAFGALVTASCGGLVAPSENVTENYTGTLEPKPSPKYIAFHSFTTSKSGEIEIKITALAPITNVFLGTFFGQPQKDGSCGFSPFEPPNERSVLNLVALTGPITPGPWCVGIYDPGDLTQPITYTLTVKHP